MNNSLKLFIKTSGIFFVGNALSKIIIFLLLPLYTMYISTASYGYYDLSVAYVTVFTSLLYFDIWSTVLRFMYDANDVKRKEQIATTCWILFFISSVIYVTLGAIICNFFSIRYSMLILLYGLSVNFHNMSGFVTRGWKKNVKFAISGIINTIIMLVGNLVMILIFHMEIEALYISAILGNLGQVLYLGFASRCLPKVIGFELDKELFKSIIRYTLPLCVNSISYWLLTSYNRVVIQEVMGISSNGIYAIGNKFGSAIALVTTCFTYAWQDLAFAHETGKKGNKFFYGNACGYYFLFLGIGFSLMIPCFSILFPLLIGENYVEAYATIPLFLIMAILSAFSTFIGNIFYAIKDTKSILTSMVVSCVCNLLLCRFLIASFGINGANLSICVSFVVNIIIRYFVLKKKIDIELKAWHYFIPCIMMLISSILYMTRSTIINCLYTMVLLIMLGVVFYSIKKEKVKSKEKHMLENE
ncbi:oligosaccharide flippase family protein [Amedibacillus sp. YH-ame6]